MNNVLSNNFVYLIEDLQKYAKEQGEALINASNKSGFLEFHQRQGYPLPLDPLDIPMLGEGVSNDGDNNPNKLYEQILNNKDENGDFCYYTAADAMAVTMQGDYLAAMRRAYTLLHASSIRRRGWAAARLKGHSNADGGLFNRVLDQINQVVAAGANYNPEQYDQRKPEERKEEINKEIDKQLATRGFAVDEDPYQNLTDWKG